MATVNATLKTDRVLSDGTHPVYLCIYNNGKRYYISLQRKDQRLFGTKENWDQVNGCFNKLKKECKYHNRTIEDSISDAKQIIKALDVTSFDITSFRKSFFGIVDRSKTLRQLLDIRDEKLISQERFKTAEVYRTAVNAFLITIKKENIEVKDVTKKHLKEFEESLLADNKNDATVHNYIRTIKALISHGVNEEIIKEAENKVRDYSLAHIKPSANKRALSLLDFNKIINAKFTDSNLELTRLTFLFSVYTFGMNFADMCLLKENDIYDKEIKYKRLKTGKNLTIPFTSQASQIFLDIMQNPIWSNQPYVFPYMKDNIHNTPKKLRTRLDTARAYYNENLKELANKLQINFHLTSYSSRHTFSVLAYNNKASKSSISSLLGHSTEAITNTYLESLTSNHLSGIETHLPLLNSLN